MGSFSPSLPLCVSPKKVPSHQVPSPGHVGVIRELKIFKGWLYPRKIDGDQHSISVRVGLDTCLNTGAIPRHSDMFSPMISLGIRRLVHALNTEVTTEQY